MILVQSCSKQFLPLSMVTMGELLAPFSVLVSLFNATEINSDNEKVPYWSTHDKMACQSFWQRLGHVNANPKGAQGHRELILTKGKLKQPENEVLIVFGIGPDNRLFTTAHHALPGNHQDLIWKVSDWEGLIFNKPKRLAHNGSRDKTW